MTAFDNGAIRLEYILDAPLSENVERQWPQMSEVVKGRDLVARVEAEFDTFTLEVGRRLRLGDVVIVEWSCDYGDGRIYRNVTIGELQDGVATKVTDYWGEPSEIPSWRRAMTAPLVMAADGTWPDRQHLLHT
jgi:hypothetical protein